MNLPAETDLAVVGGGPGGYVAAVRAAENGADVTLIERDAPGGVCLNHGCIPSKALLSATGLAHRAGNAERMGVYADPRIAAEETRRWTDRVVRRLTRGVELLCERAGVTVVDGTATFESADALRVSDQTLSFERAVVATGSRPIELPSMPFDAPGVLDSRAALALDPVPDSLVVVGGGYVGMELATVFARLGTDVVVAEMLDEVLPGFPADLAEPVRKRAADAGVAFHLNHRAVGHRETDDGVAVTLDGPDGERTVTGDVALVAVGREPVTDTVNPAAAGLPVEDGAFPTDDRQETPVDGIYAVGDAAGDPMLAHAAMHEGRIAAADATGAEAVPPARAVPAVAFTDPEVATVGTTSEAAPDDALVGEYPFRASGRALTANEREGFVRVVADAAGTVIGGEVVGPEASEVVAELGLAVATGATLDDVAATVHAHPTLAEATLEAATDALGRGVHGG
ncbi:MAG: dihydrolipoyl dehydrogenase [Halobacteriaceae archaeon]